MALLPARMTAQPEQLPSALWLARLAPWHAWFLVLLAAKGMLASKSNDKGMAQMSDFQFDKLSGLVTVTE